MPREQFFNDIEDIKWIVDGHLNFAFNSFIIIGNEDSPEKILLFTQKNPRYDDRPIVTIQFEE